MDPADWVDRELMVDVVKEFSVEAAMLAAVPAIAFSRLSFFSLFSIN